MKNACLCKKRESGRIAKKDRCGTYGLQKGMNGLWEQKRVWTVWNEIQRD